MDRAALLQDPETRRIYEQEYLLGEVTDTISGLVGDLGLTRAELARRLGLSRGRISQVLSGTENLTLKTLAHLGWALGVRFNLDPQPMAQRAGTPAVNDPPLPSWVEGLKHSTLRVYVVPTGEWRSASHELSMPSWTVRNPSPTEPSEVAA